MKTMKCKELYGPESCEVEISGATAEEMMQNSQRHGMEMYMAGDEDHVEVMNVMREKMATISEEEQAAWMVEFERKFDEAS